MRRSARIATSQKKKTPLRSTQSITSSPALYASAAEFITNPRTNRQIRVGGVLYGELVAAGVIRDAIHSGAKRSSTQVVQADQGHARKRSRRFAESVHIEVTGGGVTDSLAALSSVVASKESQIRQALNTLFVAARKTGRDTSHYEHTSDLIIATLATGDEVVQVAEVLKSLDAFSLTHAALKPIFHRVVDVGLDPLRFDTAFAWKSPATGTIPTAGSVVAAATIDDSVKHLQAQSIAWIQDIRAACTTQEFDPILAALSGVRGSVLHLAQRWLAVLRPSLATYWETIRTNPNLSVAEQARRLMQKVAAVDPELLRVLLDPSALRSWMELQLADASTSLDEMIATAVTTVLSLNIVVRTAVKAAWGLASSVIPGDRNNLRAEVRSSLVQALSTRTSILAQVASNALVVFFALSFVAEAAVKTALN